MLGIAVGAAAVGIEIQFSVGGNAAVLDFKQSRIFLADHVKRLILIGPHGYTVLGVADIVGQDQAVIDGVIFIVARDRHKEVSVLVSHALIDEGGKIPLLPVHRHIGHVQVATERHSDISIFHIPGNNGGGDGFLPLEQKGDAAGTHRLHGHSARIEGASVILQLKLPIGHQLGVFNGVDQQIGIRQDVQVFHPVHRHPIQIVGVTEVGEVGFARFAVLHQHPIARVLMYPMHHGTGIVIADLHGVEVLISHGHTLGGVAMIRLTHLAHGIKAIIVHGGSRVGGGGNHTGTQSGGGTGKQRGQFFRYAVHGRKLLIFSHNTYVLYHTGCAFTRKQM